MALRLKKLFFRTQILYKNRLRLHFVIPPSSEASRVEGGGTGAAGRRNFHGSPISEAPSPFSVYRCSPLFFASRRPPLPHALRYPRPTNNDVEKKRSRPVILFWPTVRPSRFSNSPQKEQENLFISRRL